MTRAGAISKVQMGYQIHFNLFWATTDMLAQTSGLMDIDEPQYCIGIGLFVKLDLQI